LNSAMARLIPLSPNSLIIGIVSAMIKSFSVLR
jgi:hypothetical protein